MYLTYPSNNTPPFTTQGSDYYTQQNFQNGSLPYRPVSYFPPIYQPQPVTQSGLLNGRFIQKPEDIKPNEISMDGSLSLFPQEDMSCIYVKTWDTSGQIRTIKFVKEEMLDKPEEETQESSILKRLDRIENLLMNGQFHKPKTNEATKNSSV